MKVETLVKTCHLNLLRTAPPTPIYVFTVNINKILHVLLNISKKREKLVITDTKFHLRPVIICSKEKPTNLGWKVYGLLFVLAWWNYFHHKRSLPVTYPRTRSHQCFFSISAISICRQSPHIKISIYSYSYPKYYSWVFLRQIKRSVSQTHRFHTASTLKLGKHEWQTGLP